MTGKSSKLLIAGLLILAAGLLLCNVLLGRQVGRLERQIGTELAQTINTFISDAVSTDELLRDELSPEDLAVLARSLQLSRRFAQKANLPCVAFYYELMRVELDRYASGEMEDVNILSGKLRQINSELTGLLALLERDEAGNRRTAPEYYNWLAGQDGDLRRRVHSYMQGGE